MSSEEAQKKESRVPYLTGHITDLNGNVISKIALWINKPRKKQENPQEEQK